MEPLKQGEEYESKISYINHGRVWHGRVEIDTDRRRSKRRNENLDYLHEKTANKLLIISLCRRGREVSKLYMKNEIKPSFLYCGSPSLSNY